MNYLCRFFILVFIVCAAAGCAPPTGSLYNNGSGKTNQDYDAFWVVPNRMHYDLNDIFDRQEDLSVFVAFQGIIKEIPADQVEISIIKDPEAPQETDPIPHVGSYIFKHENEGRNIVVVSYKGKSARYSVEVSNPFKIPDPDDSDDGNGGIIIIWP